MSYFKELRRRNVFRVAAGYVVVAWLILQVLDVVGPILALSDGFARVTLLLIVIGFPIALVLAWIFEITQEGIKRDHGDLEERAGSDSLLRRFDVIVIALLTVALAFFVVDKFYWSETGSEPVEPPVATQLQSEKSIAVLPFRSISATPGNEYFAEGLAEEVINLLSRIPELKVIGRTSSFAFRDKNVDIKTIAETLGVNSVLEGSVRLSGDRLRISVRLVDTTDSSQIWGNTYDRVLSDVFAVQDEVASAIIGALQVHIGDAPKRGIPTESTEAYALFLKARFELNAFLFKEAVDTLDEVLRLDPEFAEAYEMLAYTYWFLSGTTFDSAEGQKLVGAAASKALEIDPDLPIAAALDVSANSTPYSLSAEIKALEQALEVQIDNPWLLDILLFRLMQSGYLREAVEVARGFVEADPLSAVAHNRLSEALYAVGEVEAAFVSAQLVNDLDIHSDTAYWNLTHMSLAEGRDAEAAKFFESFLAQFALPDVSWVAELIAIGRSDPDGTEFTEAVSAVVAKLPEANAFELRSILESWYLYFGMMDRFYDRLYAIDIGEGVWTNAEIPFWQGTLFRRLGFTAHPRYLGLASSLGVVEVWGQRGAPDFCATAGEGWSCN